VHGVVVIAQCVRNIVLWKIGGVTDVKRGETIYKLPVVVVVDGIILPPFPLYNKIKR